MAPPRKRKSEAVEDTDSEDEKFTKTAASVSKKGRQINPSTVKSEASVSSLKFDLEWSSYGEKTSNGVYPLIYLWSKTQPGATKVAAFDIDNTIIQTKSGKNFATNSDDWTWFDKCVPAKLKEASEQGFRIVFITNQAGIEKGKVKFDELKKKFQAILSQIEVPVFILIATGETNYRKPSPVMWNFLVNNCNSSVEVDLKESVYVGDAAGRPKNWAKDKKKDFSCSDRMFAHNAGLKFLTPEEFFLGHKSVPFEWGSIDPNEILIKHSAKPAASISPVYHQTEQELVIMVGSPASGKSTFTKRNLVPFNYVQVNRDTLQTQAKCLKAAEEALKAGKSVCVDNTNPNKKTRQEYIDLARKCKVNKIRCFRMKTDIELCHHLNYVRQNHTKGQVRRIPDVGFNVFKSQLEEPTVGEGFAEIVEIHFEPKFDDTTHETIFKQWTS